MRSAGAIFLKFLPFWAFLLLFKLAGALHYTLLAPFGETLLPIWLVGLIIGGESLIQVTLDLPAGYLLDKLGYRKLLKYTTVAFMFCALCFASGLTTFTYLLSVALSVFGWLFFLPGSSAYILSHATDGESGRFFSIRDVSNSVGVVIASVSLPFILLFTPQAAGFFLMLVLVAAFIALWFAPADKRLPPRAEQTPHQRRHLGGHRLQTLWHKIWQLNPASGMLVLLTFAAGMFYGTIWFVVPLVIASQANSGVLGLGLAVFDFSVVVLGYLIGTWADKSNKRAFVFFGLLIFALCGMSLGFNFGIFFLFFGFLATAGEEMAGISLWSWLHHLDHEHDADGVVSGVITLFDDLGYGLGPIVAGISYTWMGPQFAIALGALPILLCWLVYYLFVHRHAPFELTNMFVPERPRRVRHKS